MTKPLWLQDIWIPAPVCCVTASMLRQKRPQSCEAWCLCVVVMVCHVEIWLKSGSCLMTKRSDRRCVCFLCSASAADVSPATPRTTQSPTSPHKSFFITWNLLKASTAKPELDGRSWLFKKPFVNFAYIVPIWTFSVGLLQGEEV